MKLTILLVLCCLVFAGTFLLASDTLGITMEPMGSYLSVIVAFLVTGVFLFTVLGILSAISNFEKKS